MEGEALQTLAPALAIGIGGVAPAIAIGWIGGFSVFKNIEFGLL